jgi:hypothetical protein
MMTYSTSYAVTLIKLLQQPIIRSLIYSCHNLCWFAKGNTSKCTETTCLTTTGTTQGQGFQTTYLKYDV